MAIQGLEKEHMPKKEKKKKKSSWFSWGRSAETSTENGSMTEAQANSPTGVESATPTDNKGISASSSTSTLIEGSAKVETGDLLKSVS